MSKRTCSHPDCDKPHLARGFCSYHYYQWRRANDPERLEAVRAANRRYGKTRKALEARHRYLTRKLNGDV